MKSTLKTIVICCLPVLMAGCQSSSKASSGITSKVAGLFGLSGKDKVPEVDTKSIVDISKTTLEQLEKMTLNMPTGQWVYIENNLQGVYSLQNKSADGHMLFFRLNCKIPSQKPGFSIQNKDGQDILKAYDEQAGPVQFLLDNKNYGNPFDAVNPKKLQPFTTALKTASTLKIFNASRLYTFQNGHPELLDKPVSCRE
ncbi:hypothetical protein [Acinetobacter sp. WZC-1]|uniref:hypothetical protein n=1 Tax=Acinetobacter sp. WZC-1 TaxID=3459034 RepID=UPI00403D8321